jgi:YgiT-type zinc finger domain-containing protein
MMKITNGTCEYCEGHLIEKKVTVTHRWKGTFVVIENVPALVCQLCGERYFSAQVLKQMERIARSRTEPKRVLQVPVRIFQSVALK